MNLEDDDHSWSIHDLDHAPEPPTHPFDGSSASIGPYSAAPVPTTTSLMMMSSLSPRITGASSKTLLVSNGNKQYHHHHHHRHHPMMPSSPSKPPNNRPNVLAMRDVSMGGGITVPAATATATATSNSVGSHPNVLGMRDRTLSAPISASISASASASASALPPLRPQLASWDSPRGSSRHYHQYGFGSHHLLHHRSRSNSTSGGAAAVPAAAAASSGHTRSHSQGNLPTEGTSRNGNGSASALSLSRASAQHQHHRRARSASSEDVKRRSSSSIASNADSVLYLPNLVTNQSGSASRHPTPPPPPPPAVRRRAGSKDNQDFTQELWQTMNSSFTTNSFQPEAEDGNDDDDGDGDGDDDNDDDDHHHPKSSPTMMQSSSPSSSSSSSLPPQTPKTTTTTTKNVGEDSQEMDKNFDFDYGYGDNPYNSGPVPVETTNYGYGYGYGSGDSHNDSGPLPVANYEYDFDDEPSPSEQREPSSSSQSSFLVRDEPNTYFGYSHASDQNDDDDYYYYGYGEDAPGTEGGLPHPLDFLEQSSSSHHLQHSATSVDYGYDEEVGGGGGSSSSSSSSAPSPSSSKAAMVAAGAAATDRRVSNESSKRRQSGDSRRHSGDDSERRLKMIQRRLEELDADEAAEAAANDDSEDEDNSSIASVSWGLGGMVGPNGRYFKKCCTLHQVASWVVLYAPCFWYMTARKTTGRRQPTDRAIVARLNVLVGLFAICQVASAVFLVIVLFAPNLVPRKAAHLSAQEQITHDSRNIGGDVIVWNIATSLGLTGILSFMLFLGVVLTVRVVRNVNLVGAIRYLWVLLWILPYEIYSNIGLYDYFRVTDVWVKQYWRDQTMGWFREKFCDPPATANAECTVPLLSSSENETQWCLDYYNSTNCVEIRNNAQANCENWLLSYYYFNAGWGLVLICLLFLIVNTLESIISKPLVQKSRQSNVPAWLSLPTISCLLFGLIYSYATTSGLSSRSDTSTNADWIGPLYLLTAGLFFLAATLGGYISMSSITNTRHKRNKMIGIALFILLTTLIAGSLIVLFSASVTFSSSFVQVPLTQSQRGDLACFLDGAASCSLCDLPAGDPARCPQWTVDDVTKVIQTQAKASSALAAILLIYALSAFRFGLGMRKHIRMYQIQYV